MTFAAADAEAAGPNSYPQDQKCTLSDFSYEANQHAPFKLPVHPMLAAAISNPDIHVSQPTSLQVDDMHSPCESETRDDADPGTTAAKRKIYRSRFSKMSEIEKSVEHTLDAMFFKTSKYDMTTGRSM